jgi:hypothetical protein
LSIKYEAEVTNSKELTTKVESLNRQLEQEKAFVIELSQSQQGKKTQLSSYYLHV